MPYYSFDNGDNEPYGSFEVFYHDSLDPDLVTEHGEPYDGEQYDSGWYWWPCYPGCLPDGGPVGPFETESDAISDANDFS